MTTTIKQLSPVVTLFSAAGAALSFNAYVGYLQELKTIPSISSLPGASLAQAQLLYQQVANQVVLSWNSSILLAFVAAGAAASTAYCYLFERDERSLYEKQTELAPLQRTRDMAVKPLENVRAKLTEIKQDAISFLKRPAQQELRKVMQT